MAEENKTISLKEMGSSHRISPRVLRHACDAGHIPHEAQKEVLSRNGKTRLLKRYYIDPESPQVHAWLEEYKTACLANQAQRARQPILALGMVAAWNGISLAAYPQADQTFMKVESPLKEVLYCIEHQGQHHPDEARAAAKGEVMKVIKRGRGNGAWLPEQASIDQYVDQFFDHVLGVPLWESYLSFCHREKIMIAAYRHAFFSSQEEWHPQPGGDESIFLEGEDEGDSEENT